MDIVSLDLEVENHTRESRFVCKRLKLQNPGKTVIYFTSSPEEVLTEPINFVLEKSKEVWESYDSLLLHIFVHDRSLSLLQDVLRLSAMQHGVRELYKEIREKLPPFISSLISIQNVFQKENKKTGKRYRKLGKYLTQMYRTSGDDKEITYMLHQMQQPLIVSINTELAELKQVEGVHVTPKLEGEIRALEQSVAQQSTSFVDDRGLGEKLMVSAADRVSDYLKSFSEFISKDPKEAVVLAIDNEAESDEERSLYLNASFPDYENKETLTVGVSAELRVSLDYLTKDESLGTSEQLSADKAAMLQEFGKVDVMLLCPEADVQPIIRTLDLPPRADRNVPFTAQYFPVMLSQQQPQSLLRTPTLSYLSRKSSLHKMKWKQTTNTEIPDAGLALPTRDKFTLWFQKTPDRGLNLNMVVPPDSSYADEARARERYTSNEDTFPVRCTIDPSFNLDAERETFKQRLRELYASDIGQILRNVELTKISDPQLREVLQPLVSQGQNVFRRLFASEQINYEGYADEEVEIVRAAILSALSRSLYIDVNSDCPLFPWAFLYYDAGFDSSNYSTIKPERFWGFMHEIQEEFSTTPRVFRVDANPKVVTAVDPLVDNSGFHDAHDHPFAKVTRVDASNVGDLKATLANFEGHCLYFYGHADHTELPTQASSWLELQQLKLYVSDLEPLRAPQFKNNPVVAFLNGCNTSPLTKWDSNTVVGYLCHRGQKHLCCVASVGELPAPFTAAFAREFWEKFLIDRLPIGTALLLARGHMLHQWNNPLGLLYSLFGRVDTFIPIVTAPVTSTTSNASPN